jgi:hypothetical protein
MQAVVRSSDHGESSKPLVLQKYGGTIHARW